MNPRFNDGLETVNELANVNEEASAKPRRIWQPPSGACCMGCGSADITGLPTYSVGSGVALRPQADDVLCRTCGQIAPPRYEDVR